MRRCVQQSGSLTVEQLQMGYILHDRPKEDDLFFGARIILKRQFFQKRQFIQLTSLKMLDFDAIVRQEALLQLSQPLNPFNENDEIGLKVQLVETS
jgi:hypothetical protein